MSAMPDWLTEEAATQYLKDKGLPVTKRYLRDQRRRGRGPPCKYFGVHILYSPRVLDAWVTDEALVDETWSRRRKVKPAEADASISPLIDHNAGPPLDGGECKRSVKRKPRAKDKRPAKEKPEERAD
jgi:hypothetical protein